MMPNRRPDSGENDDENFTEWFNKQTEKLRPVEDVQFENRFPITRQREIVKPQPRTCIPVIDPAFMGSRDASLAKNYGNRLAIRFDNPIDPGRKPQASRIPTFRYTSRAQATPYADSKHPGTTREFPRLLNAISRNFNASSSKIPPMHFAKTGAAKEKFDESQTISSASETESNVSDSKHPGTTREFPQLLNAISRNFNASSSKIPPMHFAKTGAAKEKFDESQTISSASETESNVSDSKHPGTTREFPQLLNAISRNFNASSSKIPPMHFAKTGAAKEKFDESQTISSASETESNVSIDEPIKFNTQTASMQESPKRCDLNNDDCIEYEEFFYWDDEQNKEVSYRIPKTEQKCPEKVKKDEKGRFQSEHSWQRYRESSLNSIKNALSNLKKSKDSWKNDQTRISAESDQTPIETAAKHDLGKDLDEDTTEWELRRCETNMDLVSLADTPGEHKNDSTSVESDSSTTGDVPKPEEPNENKRFLRLNLPSEDDDDSERSESDKPRSPVSCWRSDEERNRQSKKKTRQRSQRSPVQAADYDLPLIRWPPPPLSSGSREGSESSFDGDCEFEMYVLTCGDCACSVEDRIGYK